MEVLSRGQHTGTIPGRGSRGPNLKQQSLSGTISRTRVRSVMLSDWERVCATKPDRTEPMQVECSFLDI